jgi:hypothetical protein
MELPAWARNTDTRSRDQIMPNYVHNNVEFERNDSVFYSNNSEDRKTSQNSARQCSRRPKCL